MSNDHETHPNDKDETSDQAPAGQVSEVSGMRGEPAPIYPSDATAGTPEGESGKPQEGTASPNAAPIHDPPEPTNTSSR